MSQNRTERGFTLIELLVVITILGLLAGFAAVRVFDAVEEGRVTRARADIDTYGNALRIYRLKNGRYPTTSQGLELLTQPSANHPEGILEKYNSEDPWGNLYEYTSDGGSYLILSYGRDGVEGGEGFDADIRSDEGQGDSAR
jgi:general secretion pathway protein G